MSDDTRISQLAADEPRMNGFGLPDQVDAYEESRQRLGLDKAIDALRLDSIADDRLEQFGKAGQR